ncbi:MAG: branched-chain amino acid ABC transporter permease [Desulfobacula sp.]|jgi:branched-chain amino acid transport system permease protein
MNHPVISRNYIIERWSRSSRMTVFFFTAGFVGLFFLPLFAGGLVIDKLTTLFIYMLLSVMWNLLAGYAGLISVGQQVFFGMGAYFAIHLVKMGIPPYPALIGGCVGAGLLAIPVSVYALRLKGGEFAIGMWVIAEVVRIFVMFDPMVQGETGTSLLALNHYDPQLRQNLNYWFGLCSVAVMFTLTFIVLRSRIGSAAQAIRDNENAADSVGINVMRVKQIIFVLAAFGCSLAGTVWLASAITFQPRTNFGIQWTVFMLFMVLVGGLGTFEGPVIGALIFFLLQEIFGGFGVWYLSGLGLVAVLFTLYLPEGLWGALRRKIGQDLLSTGVLYKRASTGKNE